MIPYDELTGRIIDLRQTRDQTNFEAGDLCWYAIEKLSIEPGVIAADTGYSTQHIRDLARTSMTFHSKEDRRPREYVEWTHYKLAARTDRPVYWLDQAEANAWSSRELQRRIKEPDDPDPFDAAKRAFRAVEKVIEGGGEAAEWIITQLAECLSLRSTGENGAKGLTAPQEHTANIAGPPGSG